MPKIWHRDSISPRLKGVSTMLFILFKFDLSMKCVKFLLILTCAIQMINITAIEPGIRDQKYSCHCLCLSPLSECLRSPYSMLLQKIPAAV